MLLGNDDNEVVRWSEGERLEQLFEQQCDRLLKLGKDDHLAVASAEKNWTYEQLDQRANQIARLLRAKGINPGDRVGLLFDRSVFSYLAMLAVLKINASYVPLDASFPSERIGYIVEDAELAAIVTLSLFDEAVMSLDVEKILLDRQVRLIDQQAAGRLDAHEKGSCHDQLAYIIYTSGTTGNPKGVAVEHASVCNFLRVAGDVYGVKQSDRVYQGMTIAFDFSMEEIWVAFTVGATLVPGPGEANLLGQDLADFLNVNRVTALCCVPTLLATIPDDLPNLRFLLVSGEACPQDLVSRWHKPERVMLNAYGPTEATVTATLAELYPNRPVTIGSPLPTYTIVMLKEGKSELVGKGEIGEIGIAGIGLARGYVNRDDLTQEVFIEDFVGLKNNPSGRIYRTGDLGRITEDNEVQYLGRIDSQVKVRGYRIELTEIESVLLDAKNVGQAVVTTVPSDDGSNELAAFYTVKDGADGVDRGDVANFLRDRLPGYMVPAYFEELDAIPMLPSNKADRKKLPTPTRGRVHIKRHRFVTPRNNIEQELAAALCDVLGMKDASVEDNFFSDLGAHSLLMSRYVAQMKQRLPHVNITMRDIYQYPTIARLAEVLALKEETSEPADRRVPVGEMADDISYYLCGTLQYLYYVGYALIALAVLFQGSLWVLSSEGFVEVYLRTATFAALSFSFFALLPIAIKWLVIGRWTADEFPVWSLKYFRFWCVQQLIQTNPLILFQGTELYNMYLRLLGARIGKGVVIQSRVVPVATDLLDIGSGTLVRKEALLTGYRAHSGILQIGRVFLGRNVVIGNGSVLDIDVGMEDGAQLGHVSALHEGQTVPANAAYHGSPAVETTTNFKRVEERECSSLRRCSYAFLMLAFMLFVSAPALALLVYLLFPEIFGSAYSLEGLAKGLLQLSLRDGILIIAATLAIFVAALVIGLIVIAAIPRLARRSLKAGQTYRLFGWQYYLYSLSSTLTSSRFYNILFGDSIFIVYFLKWIGWTFPNLRQSGSNFGSDQKYDDPFLCQIGSGTLISDGLSMDNAEMSNSSFRLDRISVGERNFFGNDIVLCGDSKIGDNVLLGTRTLVPLEGMTYENVGLLGSPCFVIPRKIPGEYQYDPLQETPERNDRLRQKTVHNTKTLLLFLSALWVLLILPLLLTWGALIAYNTYGIASVTAAIALSPVLMVAYMVFIEGLSLRFGRLSARNCTIHDPFFWKVERHWKMGEFGLKTALKGTPFRPFVFRLLGSKVGRKVYDDGCVMSEKSMVEIGDECCLNESSIIQCHSLEDGLFKSGRTKLGNNVTVGVRGYIHYDVSIEDDAMIDADSFVMKGTQIADSARWRGNPASEI